MSSILDALKKSDQQRLKQQLPSGVLQQVRSSRRSSFSLKLLAICLIVLTAGFGAYQWYTGNKNPTADPDLKLTQKSTDTGTDASVAEPITAGDNTLSPSIDTDTQNNLASSNQTIDPKPINPAQDTTPSTASQVIAQTNNQAIVEPVAVDGWPSETTTEPPVQVPPVSPVKQLSDRTPPQPSPVINEQTDTNIQVNQNEVATDLELPPEQALPNRSSENSNFLTLSQISAETQQIIKDLKINIVVYDQNVNKRFAMINSKRKIEGQTIIEGILLAEIRRDGLVFETNGQLVFLPN